MSRMITSAIKAYPKSFWALILIILATLITVLYVNNFTNAPVKNITLLSESDSKQLYAATYDTERKIESTISFIEQVFVDSGRDLEQFKSDVELVARSIINENDLICNYFFITKQEDIFTKQDYTKQEPVSETNVAQTLVAYGEGWYRLYDSVGGKIYIAYISYLNDGESLLGYIGFMIDSGDFSNLLESGLTPSEADRIERKILINNAGQVIYDSANINFSESYSYDEIIRQAVVSVKDSGIFVMDDSNGDAWIYIAHNLPSKLMLVESSKRSNIMALANMVILIIAITAIIALLFVQSSSQDGLSIFEKACNRLMKGYINNISPLEESSTKAALSLHFGGILTLFSYFIFVVLCQPELKNIAFAAMLLLLVIGGLAIHRHSAIKPKVARYFVLFALIAPLLVHLYFGGFSSYSHSAAIFWIWMSFILALFIVDRQHARKIFSWFIVVVFIEVIVEMVIYSKIDYQSLYFYILNLLALGFALYSAIDIYVVRTVDSHAKTLSMLEELKSSQSTLVQREKMIMLGQLISGVAHEINTPIGAIKASAETISATMDQTLRSVMEKSRQFTSEDYDILFKLIHYASSAISEMKSTSELRRQRNALRQYLEEIELPNSNSIVDSLFRLEICDVNMVTENIEMFKSPKIAEILSVVCNLSSLIVGTETILVATGKVSKIVFALKSYSHTNVSDEFLPFDLVKSIETVLILYHNQIKASVVIERDYGENIPLCFGNSDELSQVWTNLIQNALYAMSNSGTLSISIKYADNQLAVSISDTGSGISKEALKKIFDPFYTTKPLGEGSGLGLDICSKIIAKHNGSISVKSEPSVGTTFTILLPTEQTSQIDQIGQMGQMGQTDQTGSHTLEQ